MTSFGNDRSVNSMPTNQPSGDKTASEDKTPTAPLSDDANNDQTPERPKEHGGQAGLEPTRYGDWEKKGRCTDF